MRKAPAEHFGLTDPNQVEEEAPETIVATVRGEGRFSPVVVSKVTAWARGQEPAGLMERELEVLRLVAEGLSNKEIARRLKANCSSTMPIRTCPTADLSLFSRNSGSTDQKSYLLTKNHKLSRK